MKLIIADDDQKRARDALTFRSWGTSLTPEQFTQREQQLRQHPWARRAMTTWLLCDDRDSVVSSCETFRMVSVSNGREGASHALASVFSEPALRGRGYASTLMKLLTRELPERDPAIQTALLFSDVGIPLYEQAGFESRPALDWVFPAVTGDAAAAVDELIEESRLEAAFAEVPRPDQPFFIWPTADQIDWHIERERTYSALLALPRPRSCGARAGRSVIFWAAKHVSNELVVLLLHAGDPRDAEALFLAARRAAAEASLQRVRWWDSFLPFPLPEALAGGRRIAREGELPMLRPFQPEIRARDWTWIPRAIWV